MENEINRSRSIGNVKSRNKRPKPIIVKCLWYATPPLSPPPQKKKLLVNKK